MDVRAVDVERREYDVPLVADELEEAGETGIEWGTLIADNACAGG